MTQTKPTTKHTYDRAKRIALSLLHHLAPHCQRIEIAGSLRRKADVIGDIELVAIPKYEEVAVDLFGKRERRSLLDAYLEARLTEGSIAHAPHKRWGQKMKAFTFESTAGEVYKVDLFIQTDPATWSCNLVTRTGSADFSHWMVTPRLKGGALPGDCRWENARIWQKGQAVELPEEEDLFEFLGLDYIPPEQRDRGRWGMFS